MPVGHRLNNSRPTLARSTALGTKPECNPWNRQAKATKCGGKGDRTSEHLGVPLKPGNRSRRDPAEGRGCQVIEPLEGNMADASKSDLVSTKQQRIAELAKQSPEMGFTSLAHHIDLHWLYQAYLRTRPDGAPGVDGQTVEDFTANLRANLEALLNR